MSNQQDDSVFVRNFSLVLLFLVVVGLTAFVLAKIVNGGAEVKYGPRGNEAANVAPVGAVNTGGDAVAVAGANTGAEVASTAAPAAAASSDPGKSTYDSVCFACHAQGIAGAPKHGDVAAWESRVAQGHDTLVQHAIAGFTGQAGMMPARGGNPTLTDAQVTAAVEYMMAAVGGKKEGDAAPAAAPAAEPAAAAPAADAAAAAPAVADAGKGKATYDAVCFVCHTPGAAGAPKLGDKAGWEPRIAKGVDVLHASAINGFMGSAGMMPPKGGRPDLADADVKAAVDYMLEAVK
ncbi:MAG: cytochrome c5 family protein [Proteobacteria bacterium]|nr:cytochrome c5 family protein [Pseudomonadota bacterium]